jgi:hypothetical protein
LCTFAIYNIQMEDGGGSRVSCRGTTQLMLGGEAKKQKKTRGGLES